MGKWLLAHELRRLRGTRPVPDVAKALRMTNSTVHRWEIPGVEGMIPSPGTLSRLLEYYETPEKESVRLQSIRTQAKTKGWWQALNIDQYYADLIGLEAEANELESHEALLIPGLIQTDGYSRAVVKGTRTDITEDTVEQRVMIRERRQEQWLSADGPHLWAIIGEASMRQLVGGKDTMRSQLKHLLEISEHPRLRLQVLPFSAGSHAGMEASAFQILQIEEVNLKAVYVEGRASRLSLDDEQGVREFSEIFDLLKMAAQDVTATRDLINRIREEI